MKLGELFANWDAALARIGAKPIPLSLAASDVPAPKIDLKSGYSVNIDEVGRDAQGLFNIAGQKVVIYIRDQNQFNRDKIIRSGGDGPRFHLTDCRTIDDMKSQNRYQRYVAIRPDSNAFVINFTDGGRQNDSLVTPLFCCKNCLKKTNLWGCGDKPDRRQEIHENFDFRAYFNTAVGSFAQLPHGRADTDPLNAYPPDWSDISRRMRESAGWRCQKCQVNLSDHPGHLHVHHKNGRRNDNTPANLLALCVLCHADEPQHGHLRVTPDARYAIEKLRKFNFK